MKRVILGQRNPSEYGLWISKPGADAMSTNIDDFHVHPSFNNASGILTFSAGTTWTSIWDADIGTHPNTSGGGSSDYHVAFFGVAVPHAQPYIPQVLSDIVPSDTPTTSSPAYAYQPASVICSDYYTGGTYKSYPQKISAIVYADATYVYVGLVLMYNPGYGYTSLTAPRNIHVCVLPVRAS